MTTATHTPALRATFLAAFDNFSTDPSEIATLPEVGNVRYARELLGVLVQAGLLEDSYVNGAEQVWQVVNPGTYDSATREQAEAVIDQWLEANVDVALGNAKPKAARRTGTASKRNPAALPLCLCGCGTPGKSDYRPGHDARHAGNLARAALSGEMTTKQAIAGLSMPLAAKVIAQINRGNNKVTTAKGKATPKQARKSLVGAAAWVKVGRWFKQGEVTSTTVNAKGQEDVNSEVCVVTYIGKGGEPVSVSVDTAAMDGKWGMGAVPGI